MKKLYVISLTLAVFIISCNSASDNKNDNADIKKSAEKETVEETEKESDVLVIEGENIWVRNKPSTGEVVMKLNNGDKCKIIEKGKKEQIRDMVDYWYKISYNDKEGWVFGSQTNLKTGEQPVLEDFATFLGEFVENSKAGKSLAKHIHKQIGVYEGNNPGVMCSASHSMKANLKLDNEIPSSNIFSNEPVGGFCEGYPNVKSGLYFKEIAADKLPQFGSYDEDGNVSTHSVEIPNSIEVDKFMQVTVISGEYHNCYLYFASVDFSWYFVCVNYCDCSA